MALSCVCEVLLGPVVGGMRSRNGCARRRTFKSNTTSLREHAGACKPVTLQYNYSNLVRTVLDVLPMVLIPYL